MPRSRPIAVRSQNSYFADIYDSSRQLDRLIENLLHLCRSEENNIELDLQTVNLELLVDKAVQSVSEEASDRNITIEQSREALSDILIDAQWMELILHNLVSNAVAHCPDNARVSIAINHQGNYCSLDISNPLAVALNQKDLAMIFKRFWRKDVARETGRHAGIGLSLVRSFVDLMNLEVNAEIVQDRFHIQLSQIQLT